MDSVRGAISVNQRLSKEKTLRDITNRLETKPISMKPNRNGFKGGGSCN